MLNFLGIGAQKAGTTWLYEMLSQHPAVGFPGGKEIHFWDLKQAQGIQWYKHLFANPAANLVQGEMTPAYAILPIQEIRKIYFHYPDIQLIYILRNPLERAWSAALMALQRAEMTIDEASDQWFIDHFYSQGSLKRGDYLACMQTWLQVYSRQQLLVLRYESIQREPLQLLTRCCQHLHIDPVIYQAMPRATLHQSVFAGSGHPLRPQLKQILLTLYSPKIEQLNEYLQQDFSIWLQ